jgi:hypothetical protein
MPPLGFEPTISAGERPKTYALDRAATGTGKNKQHTREMTRVSLDKLQAGKHYIRHSCARRNALEKGVDGQTDAKRFRCVGSVALCLGLDQTRREAAKL